MRPTSSFVVLAVVIAAVAACSAEAGEVGASEANVTGACEVVAAKDGHVLTQAELAALGDPIALRVLSGEGCPGSLAEVNAKLVTTDPCEAGEPGVATRFVSERTTHLDVADGFRTVTSRQCNKRKVHELLVSGGVKAGPGGEIASAKLGSLVELIGERRDAASGKGVYNYYAREGGRWVFFGGSDEMVSQGYDCNGDGACTPKAAAKQRCAGCHVGGGLIMKELISPWTHWEASRGVPMAGTNELTSKFADVFGKRLNGTELETAVVRPGNDEWARERLEVLKKQGLRETLRPLFCTLDINLELPSQPGPEVGVPLPQALNHGIFLDSVWPQQPHLAGGPSLGKAEIKVGQHFIDSVTKKPLARDGEVLRSSLLPVPGALSITHRELLVSAGIIDADFVKDVLSVDLTRPLYSKARCSLVELVPDLPAAEMQPARIKSAIAEALASAPAGPAADLRKSLLDTNDEQAHDAEVTAFLTACRARQTSEPDAFAVDLVTYMGQLRNAARRSGEIIELPEMLATNDLPDSDRVFDRLTCKLSP